MYLFPLFLILQFSSPHIYSGFSSLYSKQTSAAAVFKERKAYLSQSWLFSCARNNVVDRQIE